MMTDPRTNAEALAGLFDTEMLLSDEFSRKKKKVKDPADSLLPVAPLSPMDQAVEKYGMGGAMARNIGSILTAGLFDSVLMPEMTRENRAQYKTDLKSYSEAQDRATIRQEQADFINGLDVGNLTLAEKAQLADYDTALGKVFNPAPATYTEGKWQFDPNRNNGEGEPGGAWYLERQASDGTTKKDYADPNFRPQVAMPGADYIDKEVGASQEKLFDHQGNAQGARNVIGQMEQIGEDSWTSGIQAKTGEAWKNLFGKEDYLTSVRKNYSDIKVRNAIGNLPPGVASDKDIELVMEPWPEGTSDYGFIKRKLEAIAKVEEGRAAYRAFEADYISKNRRRDGLAKAWADTDHAKRIAGDNVPAPTMRWERLSDVK